MTSELSARYAKGMSFLARPGSGLRSLVLLHGIGSNAQSFSHLTGELPEELGLLAWNAPGYAASEPLSKVWPTAEDYARALAGLLDAAKLDTVDLLGHSLGTLIAAEFARLFPDRIGSLVLASAALGYAVPPEGDMPAKVQGRIDDLNRLGPVDFAKSRAANLVHDPKRNPKTVARVQSAMEGVNPHGYGQAVRMLASGNLAASLRAVPTTPAFIIGAEDRVTPIAQTRAAMAAWAEVHPSNPPLRVIEGAGHAVYAQQPARFAEALLALLDIQGQSRQAERAIEGEDNDR